MKVPLYRHGEIVAFATIDQADAPNIAPLRWRAQRGPTGKTLDNRRENLRPASHTPSSPTKEPEP